MAVVLSAAGWVMYTKLSVDLMNSLDTELRSFAQVAVGDSRPQVLIGRYPLTLIESDEAFSQVLQPDGQIVQSSPAVAATALLSSHELSLVSQPRFFTRMISGQGADPVRLLAVPVHRPTGREYVVVGATLGDFRDARRHVLTDMAIVLPFVLVFVTGVGWLLSGAALRPVERMRREAEAISVSGVPGTLPVPVTGDELARLSRTLNLMLARLGEALGRERRFVDQASHELRTPLAVLRTELDLALSRPRDAAELTTALRHASEETDYLSRVAEDMLVLARVHNGRLPIHRASTSLDALLAAACARHQPRAGRAGVHLEVHAPAQAVMIDPVRLRQAVENLLDNSLRYAPAGSTVRVLASTGQHMVQVLVEDSGPGFPPDLLGIEFEAFTSARAPAGEQPAGAGLGLTIVRAAAEAHGGTARAQNRPEGGARVTLTLPDATP